MEAKKIKGEKETHRDISRREIDRTIPAYNSHTDSALFKCDLRIQRIRKGIERSWS